MNISTSEYSSGCESGWTTYLDQLSNSTDPYSRAFITNCENEKGGAYLDEEGEDLSMVSDASSGPPHHHFHDDYEKCCGVDDTQYYVYKTEDKKKSSKQKSSMPIRAKKQQNHVCLDDTASSSIFHFSQDNATPSDNRSSAENVSQVFPAAHFEGESVTKRHFGFFKSSTKGKSGSLLGRKRH